MGIILVVLRSDNLHCRYILRYNSVMKFVEIPQNENGPWNVRNVPKTVRQSYAKYAEVNNVTIAQVLATLSKKLKLDTPEN